MLALNLPPAPVPDRVSLVTGVDPGERKVFADLDGPGCIRHIWVTMTRSDGPNRDAVIRIWFDNEDTPRVEAPVGDFFGVMHGKAWYPVNTPFLSVKAQSGYNCYFPMPFAQSARVEFESGEEGHTIFCQVDWHRFPEETMEEPMRFCARWRREVPTERYGEDFLMLDADGPGRLLGFVYGVRLMDNTDRWSHGGADNIYVDGDGEHPAYLRGIGGEDTFGTSYGGAIHPPETHLHAAMPYYVHEDTGEARPAQRVAGYRFLTDDEIRFQTSLHMRFGCMENDVCATTYWYQQPPVRPFFRIPDWRHLGVLQPRLRPGDAACSFPRGTYDLPLPASGEWWLCGPFGNADGKAMLGTLPAEEAFEPEAVYDGGHEPGSRWLTEGSRSLGRHEACWLRRRAIHGFVDFNHVFRPHAPGVGVTHPGVAIARCILHAAGDTQATLRIAWDDQLHLRVNDSDPLDLGRNQAFRACSVPVRLRQGANRVVLKLSNTIGTNHGGWAFAFQARAPDGSVLAPRCE